MKKNIFIGFVAFAIGLIAGVLWLNLNSHAAAQQRRPTPTGATAMDADWSKWSAPHDTSVNGWYREHGVVQYRTNLVTGLVEERNVQ
jgi:hypothetical protein